MSWCLGMFGDFGGTARCSACTNFAFVLYVSVPSCACASSFPSSPMKKASS